MSENAKEILEQSESERKLTYQNVRDAANAFHENEGELFTQQESVELIKETCSLNEWEAQSVLREVSGDLVDPVVSIKTKDGLYIGVVEYGEYDGCYGYVEYNKINGKQKTVVCAQCVHEKNEDSNVVYAREDEGSFTGESPNYEELVQAVHEHYKSSHDVAPESVDVVTGASLNSGTTAGGSPILTQNDEGSGGGIDADSVDGSNIFVQSSSPSSPSTNDVWIDTS